jgi:hypothetical protein
LIKKNGSIKNRFKNPFEGLPFLLDNNSIEGGKMSAYDDKKNTFRITYHYEDGSSFTETKDFFDGKDDFGNDWIALPKNVRWQIFKESEETIKALQEHIDAIQNNGGIFVKVNKLKEIEVKGPIN